MIPVTQNTLNELAYLGYRYGDIENFLAIEVNKGNLICFNEMYLTKNDYNAVYNPLRPKTDDEVLGYFTSEDNWNEYSKEERLEKLKQSKQFLPNGWVDWNSYSLDQLVDYLKHKYRFVSTGEAHAIYRLIEFYEQKKDA